MAINVTPLGVSYLDPDQLPEMLKKLELWVPLPYDDGLHIATIGIGIALQKKDGSVLTGNLALVLRKIGVFAASDASAPTNETAAQKDARYRAIVDQFAQIIQSHSLTRNPSTESAGTSASELALQSDLNAAVAQYDPGKTFTLSLDQAKEVKSEYILGYAIGPFAGSGAQAELDAMLEGLLAPAGQSVPHDTREYKALMSLYFNGPRLIGPGLRNALSSGNRAEAWYEIRYNSNNGPVTVQTGTAKRRYWESSVFGLYDDGSTVTPTAAQEVYRMLELHRSKIEQYERLFSAQISAANTGFVLSGTADEVQTLDDSLQPAVQPLLDWVNSLLPAGSIQLTSSMIDTPLGIHLSPGRNKASEQLSATYKADLNARRYTAPGSSTELEIRNILIGQEGNDTLEGGKGDDVLLGGFGEDKYVFESGDGQDIIFDQDGIAEVIRNGTQVVFGYKSGVDMWTQPSTAGITVTLRKLGAGNIADLELVFSDSQSDKITIKNFDFTQATADFYGLRLIDVPSLPALPVRSFFGDKQDWDSDPNEPGIQSQVDAFGNTIRADGQGDPARPDLAEPDREDFLYGSDADEVERFITAGGDDTVYADGPASTTSTMGGDDIVEAGAGSDVVAGGAGDDWIEGGIEGDILAGNEGNDSVFAESSNAGTLNIDLAIAQGEAGEQRAGQGDLMSGDAGDDVLLSDAGADYLAGGVGEDIIAGGAGDDTIYGDGSVISALRGWSVLRTRTDVGSTVTFDVDPTGINLIEDDALGGLDVIYGGAGADWIFAGAGDDYAEGGIGDDVLFGEAGHDILLGGDGNDFLAGDSASVDAAGLSGDDYLVGGAGDDELLGGKGDDYLEGGEGFDRLSGGEGNDTLAGGTGVDVLAGGAGRDRYVFNTGDGTEIIDDAPSGPDDLETSILVLGPGISQEQVKFRPDSLVVDVGNGDSVQFLHFDIEDPLSTPVLDAIEFRSGGFMTFEDILAQGFDIDGASADDEIFGTAVTDRILAGDGNDYVEAKAGDDVIDGGLGDDEIHAGDGNDTVTAGEGADYADGGSGDDTIDGGAGDDTIRGGQGADLLSGGEGHDMILGEAGDDVLNGNEGDDTLDGGTGNDTLSGGAGSDAYVIYGGMGTDVVADGEGGETNALQLGAGLTIENLGTQRVGDSLVVSLRGTADSLKITDYYTRPQDWVVRDFAGVETAMDTVINQPDPHAGDYIGRIWADAKLGAQARAFGFAYTAGWKALDGNTFESFVEDAYQQYSQDITYTTYTRAEEPFDLVGESTAEDSSATVVGVAGRSDTTFWWSQVGLESGYVESDDPVIVGAWSNLPQVQTPLSALVTLEPYWSTRFLNYQRTTWQESGGVVAYDTGTEIVDAIVVHNHDLETYNRVSRITSIDLDLSNWIYDPYDVVGDRARVDLLGLEDRYLAVNEIIAGSSDNLVVAGSSQVSIPYATLIDGGAGNDTLQGDGGLLFGNSGDDELRGANAILIGGDGNDTITGWGGSTFVYTATEAGIDSIGDTAVATGSYLDWYYAVLGIADWQEGAEHGGQYRANVGDGGTQYFATLEEAQQSGGSDIAFVEPLPVSAPVVRRGDTATLESLESAGVLARDVVSFGTGLGLADLDVTVRVFGKTADAHPEEPWYGGGTLFVRWGSGAGFDVTIPDSKYGLVGDDLFATVTDPGGNSMFAWEGYQLGLGIELFQFADGSTYTLEEVLQQATVERLYGYQFVRGSGSQVISTDWSSVDFAADIAPSDIYTVNDGSVDLVFGVIADSALGRIPNWYASPDTIPQVEFHFADGTVYDIDAVTRLGRTQIGTAGTDFLDADPQFASALYGLGGSDFLTGGEGNDLLDGGPGNDFVLEGLGGNDIYAFGSGYGEDSVSESFEDGGSGFDTVRFDASVAPIDVSVDQDGGDLVLTVGIGGDILRLSNWFRETGGTVEAIQFDDGTVWDAATVLAMLPAKDPATEGDDILWGGMGDDVLDGLGGNDEVWGFAGDDTLYGGDGDDYLDSGSGTDLVFAGEGFDWAEAYGPGNNLLDLGAGDDGGLIEGQGVAIGGAGDDWIEVYGSGAVVLFNAGDGNDSLYLDAGSFALSLGGGIAASDLSLSRSGSDVTVSIGLNDSITLTGDFGGGQPFYPDTVLQLFGSAHLYDFDSLLYDYLAQESQNPGLVLLLDAVLPLYEFASSETDALGGAIAWEYATSGTLAALSDAQLRQVVSDPAFGIALQPMTLPSGNSAPVVANAVADQSTNEDSSFSFAVPAGTFSDPDAGDVLTYAATLADGSTLPAWLSFDAPTQTFSGTPLQTDVGAIDVKVTATDTSNGSVSDTFWITVANTNDAPTVANPIADQPAGEDSAFSFTVPANTFADEDVGDSHSYSATLTDGSALPSWLSFNATTQTFSGTPSNADVGSINVKVTAADGADASVSDIFAITVSNVNDAPVLVNAIADQMATENEPFAFAVPADSFSDVDVGDSLTYSASLADGTPLPGWLSFDGGTRTFSGTPPDTAGGLLEIRVTATDTGSATAFDDLTLDIANVIKGTEAPDTLVGTAGRDVIYGYDAQDGGVFDHDSLSGGAGDDVLIGGDGKDVLDGGPGADILMGGPRNDQYYVDDPGDQVIDVVPIEFFSEDRVFSTISWTLGDEIEYLILLGLSDIDGTGNALDNDLHGNDGNNYLSGLAGNDWIYGHGGADVLVGGEGNDTFSGGAGLDVLIGGNGDDYYYVYSDEGLDQIIENDNEGMDQVITDISWSLVNTNVESVNLQGSANVDATGNDGDNDLYGNSGNNVLTGNAGNDFMRGRGGSDILIGGVGDDTYEIYVGDFNSQIIENADEGVDTVVSWYSWTLGPNLENLVLSGSGNIEATGNDNDNWLRGNTGNNVLRGNAGNDLLTGYSGTDVLIGGTGNDTYELLYVGDNSAQIIENAGEGVDTIISWYTWTLGPNVENLVLGGTSAYHLWGLGNELDNVLTGNDGDNPLFGYAGNDVLDGGVGSDRMYGDAGNDVLDGGFGSDTMYGGTGDDTYFVESSGDTVTEDTRGGSDTVNSSISYALGLELENLVLIGTAAIDGTGNAVNNMLIGNDAANTLSGLDGADTLDGRGGSDTLVGGKGGDTYLLGRGYGADVIQENDTKTTNTDVGQFLANIAPEQLWFQQSGNDLVVTVIGTPDQFTVQSWYSGSRYRVEQFRTDDGQTLLQSQVQNLVDAMAGFAPPAPGQTDLPPDYAAQLNPTIAANWQ